MRRLTHPSPRPQRSFTSPSLTRITMNQLPSLSAASFCESVEAGHSDHGTNARIAQLLGITRDSVRMDSQAKYCSIARGDGDIYLRLPVSATYEEKVWCVLVLSLSLAPSSSSPSLLSLSIACPLLPAQHL